MYQDVWRTCTAIVLLIKPFVWWRSRCLCRLILLLVHFYFRRIKRQHAMLFAQCISPFNSGKTQKPVSTVREVEHRWPTYLQVLFGLACEPWDRDTYTCRKAIAQVLYFCIFYFFSYVTYRAVNCKCEKQTFVAYHNGQFRLWNPPAGNHGSCIRQLGQDIVLMNTTTMIITSIPISLSKLKTQFKQFFF